MSTDGGAPGLAELTNTARRAGLSAAQRPTLARVDQRRGHLWVVTLGLSVCLALGVGWLASTSEDTSTFVSTPAGLGGGVVALIAGFAAYVYEKERSLREVTRLLWDEQDRRHQDQLRAERLAHIDRIKSELLDQIDREISSLDGVAGSLEAAVQEAADRARLCAVTSMALARVRATQAVISDLTAGHVEVLLRESAELEAVPHRDNPA